MKHTETVNHQKAVRVAAGFTENLNYLSDAIKAWKQEAEAGCERVQGMQTIIHET